MKETLKFESQIAMIEKINPLVSKVLIRIAYAGLNRNNSYISRSTFDAAQYSLPRCFILGEYSETIEDFRGHGGKIEINDDSIKWVNTTIPYGFVDVDTEITWKDVVEENGDIKQYICATGYVWTGRYPELADLINNSKSQSMEIEIISGIQTEIDGVQCYEITEFIYSGFCILGDDVEPCFESSTISAYSLDKEKFKLDFAKMVAEIKFSLSETYNVVEKVMVNNPVEKWKCPHCKDFIGEKELYFNNEKWYHSPCIEKGEIQFNKKSLHDLDSNHAKELEEGGNTIVPENILALLAKYSLTENDLIEKEITYTDFSVEELEVKINETFQKEEVKPSTDFSLTSEQLEDELRRELAEIETLTEVYWDEIYTSPRFYYIDNKTDQNIVIAWDCKNSYVVGATFTLIGDNVEVDSSTIARYKVDYIPMAMSSDIDGDGKPVIGGDDDAVDLDDDMFSAFTSKAKSEFMIAAKEKSLTKQFEIDKASVTTELTSKLTELQEKFSALEAKYALTDSELANKLQAERESSEDTIFSSFANSLTEEEMADVKSKKSEFSLVELEDKLCVILGRKNKVAQSANFSKTPEATKPLGFQIPLEEKKSTGKSYDELFEKHLKKDE